MDVAVNLPFRKCVTQPISLGILKALVPDLHQIDFAPKFNDEYLKIISGKSEIFIERFLDVDVDISTLTELIRFLYPLEAVNRVEDEWDEKFHELAFKLADLILGYEPKVACFTTQRDNIGLTMLISKILAENGVRSIVGGASILWKSHIYAKEYPWVWCFYEGDAETLFPKVFNLVRKGEKIRSVKAPVLYALDKSPIPRYDDLNLNNYEMLGVETQRGCVFRCSFCNIRFTPANQNYRGKSISRVVEEISSLRAFNECFFFCDNILNPTPKRLIEFCKAIEPLEVKWCSGGLIPRISEEEAFWMWKSGCLCVGLGCESFSNRLLKWMNKPTRWKFIRDTILNLKKYGIGIEINLIKGFPKENLFDVFRTMVRFLVLRNYIDYVNVVQFCITQNSEVHLNPRKFGVNFEFSFKDSICHAIVYSRSNRLVKLLSNLGYAFIENVKA